MGVFDMPHDRQIEAGRGQDHQPSSPSSPGSPGSPSSILLPRFTIEVILEYRSSFDVPKGVRVVATLPMLLKVSEFVGFIFGLVGSMLAFLFGLLPSMLALTGQT